MGYGLSGTSSP